MTGIFNARAVETGPRSYLTGTEKGTSKLGQKVFSDLVTIKSDIGNTILRQTPILPDGTPAKPVTWVEKGVLKNLYYDQQYATRVKKDATPGHGQHEPGARGLGPVGRADDQVHPARPAGQLLLVHPRRSISRRCSTPA